MDKFNLGNPLQSEFLQKVKTHFWKRKVIITWLVNFIFFLQLPFFAAKLIYRILRNWKVLRFHFTVRNVRFRGFVLMSLNRIRNDQLKSLL